MAVGDKTQGRRIYPSDFSNQSDSVWPTFLVHGEYGKTSDGHWYVCCPVTGDLGLLDNHTVVENDDHTITVEPSILITYDGADDQRRWHGFLRNGVWEEAA